MRSVSAEGALDALENQSHSILDVRSESEIAKASIPGIANAPILHDEERRLVGTCYKEKGQEAAIRLGHRLVDPTRSERVDRWIALGKAKSEVPMFVACWRGGLRSKIATDWMREAGRDVLQVEGGYKAMRGELLDVLDNPPEMIVLSGMSGARKTQLLRDIPAREKVDVEGLAGHRGSSFGNLWQRPQPSQTTFENALALAIRSVKRPVLVEDESKVVGSCHLPEKFFQRLKSSPLIVIEASVEDRARALYEDYVLNPLAEGMTEGMLQERLALGLRGIEKRLGGALAARVLATMEASFAGKAEHTQWIRDLLDHYYDRAYRYGAEASQSSTIFRGTFEECRQWITERYV